MNFDLLIIGAGPAGLSLALNLHDADVVQFLAVSPGLRTPQASLCRETDKASKQQPSLRA